MGDGRSGYGLNDRGAGGGWPRRPLMNSPFVIAREAQPTMAIHEWVDVAGM